MIGSQDPLIVDLDELDRHFAYRASINHTPLHLITWVRNGKVIPVTRQQIDEWRFTGLTNIDFPQLSLPL